MAELNEELTSELEDRYFMVKKTNLFHFFGGAVVTAIAVVGLSYASALAAVKSSAAKIAMGDIDAARRETFAARDGAIAARTAAKTAQTEAEQTYPSLLRDVPMMKGSIQDLKRSPIDLGRRLLGELPLGTSASQVYDIPARVPADAKEILVYAHVLTGGGVGNAAREFHIYTEAPPPQNQVGFWLSSWSYAD